MAVESSKDLIAHDTSSRAAFAVAGDGRLVHVSEVHRGRASMCVCAGCRRPVIARQGARNAWHFAHDASASCSGAAETALHLAIKQLIADGDVICVPELKVEATATQDGHTTTSLRKLNQERLSYGNARLEVRMGDIVADAVVTAAGRDMIVEVAVTHDSDPSKVAKIAALGLSALELQASRLARNADWNELRAFLQDSCADRIWLYHARTPMQRQLAQMDALAQARAAARRAAVQASGSGAPAATGARTTLPAPDVMAKFRRLWHTYHRGTLGYVSLDEAACSYVRRWSEADANGDPHVYFAELLHWIRTRTDSVIEAP